MEMGRQGKGGNGLTSRVWKGDGAPNDLADIPNTDIGFYF
jgi:hypothetical protein